MKEMKSAILFLFAFTVLLGGIYPAVVTGIASAVFPKQAQGSFITVNGEIIGSALIGQPFSDPKYFWPRPSATADFGYDPAASGGSNLGPTNPAFIRQVSNRVEWLRGEGVSGDIPSDLVLASASGLDPHVTPRSALVQIPRVARARGVKEEELKRLVAAHIEGRQLGFLGAPRVNVLMLNLALDRFSSTRGDTRTE